MKKYLRTELEPRQLYTWLSQDIRHLYNRLSVLASRIGSLLGKLVKSVFSSSEKLAKKLTGRLDKHEQHQTNTKIGTTNFGSILRRINRVGGRHVFVTCAKDYKN